MSETPLRAPPCLYCLHYYVTMDPQFPRGCRVFDFKSYNIPALEVFKATGKHCPSYALNPKIRRE